MATKFYSLFVFLTSINSPKFHVITPSVTHPNYLRRLQPHFTIKISINAVIRWVSNRKTGVGRSESASKMNKFELLAREWYLIVGTVWYSLPVTVFKAILRCAACYMGYAILKVKVNVQSLPSCFFC